MSILAIDYGRSKIGLAISSGLLARPLPVLKVKNPNQALSLLTSICEKNKVEIIIFGVPYPDNIEAEVFGQRLSKTINVPIEFIDETMTSQIAVANLAKLKIKKVPEDSVAASILLTEYLQNKEG